MIFSPYQNLTAITEQQVIEHKTHCSLSKLSFVLCVQRFPTVIKVTVFVQLHDLADHQNIPGAELQEY